MYKFYYKLENTMTLNKKFISALCEYYNKGRNMNVVAVLIEKRNITCITRYTL